MNIGVIKEGGSGGCRVALTPPVVRHLVEQGDTVWVETGAGEGAMFGDDEYLRSGAQVAYSSAAAIGRSDLVVKISAPSVDEVREADPGVGFMAFYHLAVASRALVDELVARSITAIGCEIIETGGGRLPVLAAVSEVAGQMTIPLAAHLLRSSSGGRGILLGGSPGVPPAHVVILGAGTVGTWAARAARASGARVTVLDTDAAQLRRVMEHLPNVATEFAEPESIASALASADVAIGAVLVAGAKTPHIVTRRMVEAMKPGSVIIDVSIDQGGCFETSRPTTLAAPAFTYAGIIHYCVPNLTCDMGRSASTAYAQALLPYLIEVSKNGIEGALRGSAELARGVYLYRGQCVQPGLAEALKLPHRLLAGLIAKEAYALD